MNIRKLVATAGLTVATLAGTAGLSHADSRTTTDACRDDGRGTVVVGMACAPGTPTVTQVCAQGHAHLTVGADYCPVLPKVVTVGEYELGTTLVPNLAAGQQLNVVMRKTSVQSMRYRCNKLGGSLKNLKWGYTCVGVDF